MVKKNKNHFSDLLTYRKVGFGKTGTVDYCFIIDKDYRARIELIISQEMNSNKFSTCSVLLSEDEKNLLKKFITRYVEPTKKSIAFYSIEEQEKYERDEIYYGDFIVDDDDIMKQFRLIMDYLQSEYKSLSPNIVVSMYNNINNCLSVGKISR